VAAPERLMRARWLLNLLMLVLVAGLGWLVYRETAPGADPNQLATEAAHSIVLERVDDQDIVLEQGEHGWRLRTPRDLPASAFHVDLVQRFLTSAVTARYAATEVDLAAAGLTAPKLVLVADGERFAFGGLDPLGKRRYLLHEGQVLLLQEGVSAILRSPWWNLIDRRLLPPDAQVVALEFADGRTIGDRQALRHWAGTSASVVKPMRPGVSGEEIVVVLASGERQRWQWLADEQPRLLRPELGLAYYLEPEVLTALLGRKEY
jgi:hypothetical protein